MVLRILRLVLNLVLALPVAHAVRTAVVLESPELQETHSKFFKLLEDRGHQLVYFSGEEKQPLKLESYGERTYENLVLFTPQKALDSLRKSNLMQFVEKGGNVLLAAGKKLTKVQREFALECGVEFEKKGNVVLDHVNPIADDDDIYNSVIAAIDFVPSERVVGSLAGNPRPVAFSGVGMSLEPNNILAFHVLTAPTTAYSANPVKPITEKIVSSDLLFGNQIGLVTAVQSRNNARLVFSGSLDLFSNKYLNNKTFANAEFTEHVVKWGFQESGVLRMTNVKHHRADGSQPAKMLSDANRGDQPITLYPDAEVARDSLVYRVKDNLTYSLDLHELKDGKWVPYKADDVQLEFVMLDPHVRTTMNHNDQGHFSVTFEAPDVYGIFLFRVMYRRLGLSTIFTTTQVSLRPFKHDEYERFIPAAYPYYASAFSMMTGVFLFSVYFLFYDGKK
ncbi:RxLR-like protein [Plasmopara halstedii]|uniref:Dolichyl-diphosphooligosaccharide--protein glycosyltransferase 48 kDa subunit n=1 Tax=Plasmopara halstedii TaxID=4781 RepID=A0A0P1AVA8_PLAHL|nr:RxLR-like protein [Plasmopara halstedii]CEG46264.1 RxLR-like protein [Plasmopara halstedii]|eukprot:XP_024582633.1 RxLR-like protein [Plasmopara halstedii]